MNFVSMDTTRSKSSLPGWASELLSFLRATSTSKHAAHSKAEPLEISR